MALEMEYTITLVDSHNEKSTMRFDLGTFDGGVDDGADFISAQSAANQIRGALVDITDANVAKESLTNVISEDNQLPAGEILITEEAVILVHLNAPTEAQKLHALRVPAPTDAAVFLANGVDVDPTAALVVQYVQQVAQHAMVSDDEAIDVNSGKYGNGIDSGYKRTKSRKFDGR